MPSWKKLLADPAVHFAVIALVMWQGFTSDKMEQSDTVIRISSTLQAEAWATFQEQTGEAPSPTEWEEVKKGLRLESLLVHEARKLGLDRDDPIIRKRLVQKMEILARIPQPKNPTEAQWREYFEKNKQRYTTPRLIAVEHYFFSKDKRGIATRSDAAFARKSLVAGNPIESDPYLHGNAFSLRSEQAYIKLFGPDFVQNLQGNEWALVESPFGIHVARISDSREPGLPEESEIREQVTSDWRADQKSTAIWLEKKLGKTPVKWEDFEP